MLASIWNIKIYKTNMENVFVTFLEHSAAAFVSNLLSKGRIHTSSVAL
jgi:hypothetical protein